MTYGEQLKSPHWQAKRLRILERDKFTCKMCGSKEKTLHVHHGYYESRKKVWEYEDSTLHTLCEDCHTEIECIKRDLHYELAKINPLFLDEMMPRILDFKEQLKNLQTVFSEFQKNKNA